MPTGGAGRARAAPPNGSARRPPRAGSAFAASRVVPEDAGRDHARGGQGEAAERPPDEVLGPNGVREGRPKGLVRSRGAGGVEDGEVRVLPGRLDKARPKARLAEDRTRGPGEQVPRDVERAVASPRRSPRPSAKSGIDPVDARRLPGVARVALEKNPLGRLSGDPKGLPSSTWFSCVLLKIRAALNSLMRQHGLDDRPLNATAHQLERAGPRHINPLLLGIILNVSE